NTLDFNAVGRTFTIASGDTLVALGALSHTAGSISTGTVEARANVTIGAGAGGGGGDGTIPLLVAGNQTSTGNHGQACDLNINKPSATVDAGSTNLTIETFTLSSGTFKSTSGLLTIRNNFTHTAGGTFDPNNGSVTFATNSLTVDVATTETFNILTF